MKYPEPWVSGGCYYIICCLGTEVFLSTNGREEGELSWNNTVIIVNVKHVLQARGSVSRRFPRLRSDDCRFEFHSPPMMLHDILCCTLPYGGWRHAGCMTSVPERKNACWETADLLFPESRQLASSVVYLRATARAVGALQRGSGFGALTLLKAFLSLA